MSEIPKQYHEAANDLLPTGRNARTRSRHHIGESPEKMNSDEKVGYRSPPKQHRFKKGQSGNPRGRPRKSLNRQTVMIRTLNETALAEAHRVIAVGEGKECVLKTVVDAVVRSVADRAIKGDVVSARLFLQFVSSAQKEREQQQLAFFKACDDYKCFWEKEFAICDRERRPRPEPLPHPDDVLVNPRTGEATIVGPMTEDEKGIVAREVELRDELIAFLDKPNHLSVARPEVRRMIRARQARVIEEINAMLPPRLRRTYDGPLD